MLADGSPRHGFDEQDPLLQKLQSFWAMKDMEKLREETRVGVEALKDPLAWLLDVLEAPGDGKGRGKGHSLASHVVHEVQLWTKKYPAEQPSGLKLKRLQARIFPTLARCHTNLLGPLISIYQLHAAEHHHLLGHVDYLYHQGKFKEAAILSIKLNLQPEQEFEKMCVPLLLKDKTDLVEAYVEGHPDLQRQLLQLLDSWFDPSFQIQNITRQYQGVRPEKINYRTLNKMVFRFLEKYKLDPALCPNVINQRHLGTLKYLLHKRFVEKTMTQENWADHVQSTVQGSQWLQEQLVHLLVRYCGLEAAATWALRYDLPADKLPYGTGEAMETLRTQERREGAPDLTACDSKDRKESYYQLPIPRDAILFLSTWKEVQKCQEHLLQPGQVVGIDMEWRPSFGAVGGKPRVSVVQLAVWGRVFLLDMLQLLKPGGTEDEAALASFFLALFAHPAITKLGYGMSGDLRNLAVTSAAFRDVDKQLCGFLDLLIVHKQLPKCSGEARKGGCRQVDALQPQGGAQGSRLPEKGLSLLVQDVLGKPLDKMEQLSNWEKRPLREEQVLYAASDAYCLLEVYTKLLENPAALSLTLDLLAAPPRRAKAGEAKAKKLPLQPTALSPHKENSVPSPEAAVSPLDTVSAQDFRVVCDNMLQGLGRYLRCLGVDVRILDNDDEHRKAAEIARKEQRLILTSGLPYQTLQSQVGEGRCFLVNCSEKAQEQALRVLKHFNVQVTLADVFSRCQACNCNQYLKISKEKMVELMKHRGCLTGEGAAAGKLTDDPLANTELQPIELASRRPIYNLNCQWLDESSLDSELALLPLRIEAIPVGMLSRQDVADFYCCSQCGKVFWEGSHFGRVVSQFQEVLDLSEEESQRFYEQI
ncbi:exonuclease mut-7 homolog [Elgaria multicarinata webbii]|uniref:exonuclease mut-7 homolog n=1 Tax=Elgaria multicarinata webbii TaxID=159646 RepID=UPI002FCCCB8F